MTSKKKFPDLNSLVFILELEVNNLYSNFHRHCNLLRNKKNLEYTKEEKYYKMCLEGLVVLNHLDYIPFKYVYISSGFREYKDCVIIKLITLEKKEINKTLDYLSETYYSPDKLKTKILFIDFLKNEIFEKLEKAKHLWRCKDLISIIKKWGIENNNSLSDIAGLVQISIKDNVVKSKIKSKLLEVATSDSKIQLKRLFDGKIISKPIFLNIAGNALLGTISHFEMYNFFIKSNRNNIALWIFHCFRVLNKLKSTKLSKPYKSISINTTKRTLDETKRTLEVRKKSIILDIIKDMEAKKKYR